MLFLPGVDSSSQADPEVEAAAASTGRRQAARILHRRVQEPDGGAAVFSHSPLGERTCQDLFATGYFESDISDDPRDPLLTEKGFGNSFPLLGAGVRGGCSQICRDGGEMGEPRKGT